MDQVAGSVVAPLLTTATTAYLRVSLYGAGTKARSGVKLFDGLIRKPVAVINTLLLGLRITSVPRMPIVCGANAWSAKIVEPEAGNGIFTVVTRLLLESLTSIATVVALVLSLFTYSVVVYPFVPSKSMYWRAAGVSNGNTDSKSGRVELWFRNVTSA